MPITPRADEDRDAFVSRCMSAEKESIPDQDQRVAACFSMWRRAKLKKLGAELLKQAPTFAEVVREQARVERVSENINTLTSRLHELTWALREVLDEVVKSEPAAEVRGRLGVEAMRDYQAAVAAFLGIAADPALFRADGKEQVELDVTLDLLKVDVDRQLVFGFFNFARAHGEAVVDSHGETIDAEDLELGVYAFNLTSRVAGEEHQVLGRGLLVESMFFTPEKEAAITGRLLELGIEEPQLDLGVTAWWGGFFVPDREVVERIDRGELADFSVGGSATIEED